MASAFIRSVTANVRRFAALGALALPLAGCAPFATEQYWLRENGDVFLLSYVIDLPARQIVFTERYVPGDKPDPDRDLSKGPTTKVIRHIDDCQIVDATNWNCEDRGLGDEAIYMINGDLYYNFFTETRKFRIRNIWSAKLAPCANFEFSKCALALRSLATTSTFAPPR